MEQPITNNHINQKVMAKIETGQVKIKSRYYFLFRGAIYYLLAVLSFCLAVFLASFVAFAWHFTEEPFLLAVLGFTALLFVLINSVLAKKFSFFYKKPMVFGLILLLLSTVVASAFVLRTSFHNEILEHSQKNEFPVISPLYRHGCGCGCSGKTCGCNQKIHSPQPEIK